MRKLLIAATLLSGFYATSQSITPEVNASAGLSFTEKIYMLDWTMGELSTQTYKSDGSTFVGYMLTEGFYQPNYLQGKDAEEETTGIGEQELNFVVYPNPVTDKLFIELKADTEKSYQIEIMDITGNLVHTSEFSRKKCDINMQQLNAGIYLIKIYNQQEIIKIVKITKSN